MANIHKQNARNTSHCALVSSMVIGESVLEYVASAVWVCKTNSLYALGLEITQTKQT